MSAAPEGPPNDDCIFAQPVGIGRTVTGTTEDATTDGVPVCDAGNVAPGVWYSVLGDGSRLTVDVCGDLRPVVTVYCSDCSELNCIGAQSCLCDPECEPAGFSWCTESGTEYLILVHGFAPYEVGGFELTVSSNFASCPRGAECLDISAPPTNDECLDAVSIEGRGEFPFSLLGASMTPAYDSCYGPATALGRDVWFQWTSPITAPVRLNVCGTATFPVDVAVYYGCDCEELAHGDCLSLSPVTCDSSFYEGGFEAIRDDCYLFQVGATYGPGTGEGLLQVTYGEQTQLPCDIISYGYVEPCSSRGGWDAVSSTRPNEIVAENFRPTGGTGINKVCFWGTYYNGTVGDCRLPMPDEFEVIYYADDCGIPGNVIGGPFEQRLGSLQVEGPVFTGRRLSGGVPEYEYTVMHDTVPLTPNQDYWVEISNYQAYDCSWYWETTGSTSGLAYMDGLAGDPLDGYSPDELIARDLSICMYIDQEQGRPTCTTPPDNDDCLDAISIDERGAMFITVGATTDGPIPYGFPPPGAPCYHPLGDADVHNDVWYAYTAACSGILSVATCDSDFDTKLAVYRDRGCPVNDDPLACNDDACGDGDPPIQSAVVLPVEKGERYLIRVGGYRQTTGTGRVTVGYVPPYATRLSDYAVLARCLTGPCPDDMCDPPLYDGPSCVAVDFDSDGDVDLGDHRQLVMLLSGP